MKDHPKVFPIEDPVLTSAKNRQLKGGQRAAL